jgi:hypothetical protein
MGASMKFGDLRILEFEEVFSNSQILKFSDPQILKSSNPQIG